MRDLSILGDRVTLSVRIEEETLDNLVIARTALQNVGTTPILPTDYHQNISVNVLKPWKIIAVENSQHFSVSQRQNVEFKWKRVNDIRFEADPALLNPGDTVVTHVYLTNTQFEGIAKIPEADRQVHVEWKARITNLPAFAGPPNRSNATEDSLNIAVLLSGWALPFTIAVAMLFQALYLHLLSRSGQLDVIDLRGISIVLGVSFLSFAAGESISTYLFSNYLTRTAGVKHWMNLPWIILHVALLIVLYRRVPSYSGGTLQPFDTGLQRGS